MPRRTTSIEEFLSRSVDLSKPPTVVLDEAPVPAGATLRPPSPEPVPATAEHGRGLKTGREGIQVFYRMIEAAFSNIAMTIDDIFGEGDKRQIVFLTGAAHFTLPADVQSSVVSVAVFLIGAIWVTKKDPKSPDAVVSPTAVANGKVAEAKA